MTKNLNNLSGVLASLSLTQVRAEKCRRSFYYFIQEFWDTIVPEKPIWNWHIEYLANELEKVGRQFMDYKPKLYELIINIPPGTTKTTVVSIMFPVWCWIINSSSRFITASHSMKLSTRNALRSRDLLESEKFRNYFPEVRLKDDQNMKTEYENISGGMRSATSVGSKILGAHAYCVIIDDPIDPEESLSVVKRETANRWIKQTLPSRKVSAEITPIVLIMQRLHKDDPTSTLLKFKRIKHISLPAEKSNKINPPKLSKRYINGLLDPVRLSKEVLQEQREALGEYAYAGQYDQSPTPLKGGYINTDNFNIVDKSEVPENLVRNFYSDTSEGKQTSDNMATVAFSIYDGNLILWDMLLGTWKFNDFVGFRDREGNWIDRTYDSFVKQHFANWQSKHIFEAKSTGTPYMQYLLRQTDYNVIADMPKGSKLDRVGSSQPTIDSGRVWLVKGNWIDLFIRECKDFSGIDGDADDQVDVLTGAIKMSNLNSESLFIQNKPKERKNLLPY